MFCSEGRGPIQPRRLLSAPRRGDVGTYTHTHTHTHTARFYWELCGFPLPFLPLPAEPPAPPDAHTGKEQAPVWKHRDCFAGISQHLSSPLISPGSRDRYQPSGSQFPDPSPTDSRCLAPGLGQPRDPGPVAASPPGLYFGTVVPECCPGHPTPKPREDFTGIFFLRGYKQGSA